MAIYQPDGTEITGSEADEARAIMLSPDSDEREAVHKKLVAHVKSKLAKGGYVQSLLDKFLGRPPMELVEAVLQIGGYSLEQEEKAALRAQFCVVPPCSVNVQMADGTEETAIPNEEFNARVNALLANPGNWERLEA